MDVDISNLNFGELTALKDRIDARVQKMRQESGPQLAERLEKEAAAVGLTVDDVVRAGKKMKRGNGRASRQATEEDIEATEEGIEATEETTK